MKQFFLLYHQVQFCYNIEWYSAVKQVELRSAIGTRILDVHKNTSVFWKRYEIGIFWPLDNTQLSKPTFRTFTSKVCENGPKNARVLVENTHTNNEDFDESYIVTVQGRPKFGGGGLNGVKLEYPHHILGAKDSHTCADDAEDYPCLKSRWGLQDYLDEKFLNMSKYLLHRLHSGRLKFTKFVILPVLSDGIDGSRQFTEAKVFFSSAGELSRAWAKVLSQQFNSGCESVCCLHHHKLSTSSRTVFRRCYSFWETFGVSMGKIEMANQLMQRLIGYIQVFLKGELLSSDSVRGRCSCRQTLSLSLLQTVKY